MTGQVIKKTKKLKGEVMHRRQKEKIQCFWAGLVIGFLIGFWMMRIFNRPMVTSADFGKDGIYSFPRTSRDSCTSDDTNRWSKRIHLDYKVIRK